MRSRLMMKRGMVYAETISAVTAQKGPTMEGIPLKNTRAPDALLRKETV